MDPTLDRTVRNPWLRLTLAMWGMSFVMFGATMLTIKQYVPWTLIVLWLAAITTTGLVVSLALYLVLRGNPRWSAVGIAVVVATATQAVVDHLLWLQLVYVPRPGYDPNLAYSLTFNAMIYFWIYALYAAAMKLLGAAEMARERDEQLARARAAADKAQLAALRYQLNPHFLFNTLNAISSLIVTNNNAEAEATMGRLSAFLRSSLAADPNGLIALEDELDTVDAYLAIEAVRFGARLKVTMTAPPDLLDAQVPGFLLQPLVENAMKYAVAPSVAPVALTLTCAQHGEDLVLVVDDDGQIVDDGIGGTGVGLKNVRERLQLLYGARGRLEIGRTAEGFRAEVRLPLRRSGEGSPHEAGRLSQRA